MRKKTRIKARTIKLAAWVVWAIAFVSVAKAQPVNNLRVEVISAGDIMVADREATSGKPTDDAARNDAVAEPVLMADAGKGPLDRSVPGIVVFPPRNCFSVNGQFPFFPLRFQRVETGSFRTEFDVTPGPGGGVIALSQQPTENNFNQMAAVITFKSDGTIVAFNYDTYQATTFMRYVPGVQYHVAVYVGVPGHMYTVLVTPAGGNTQILAWFFAFNFTQSSVTSLDYWDLFTVREDTFKVCNFTLQ